MKDIFTELYKKVVGFFQAAEEKEDASKNVACNRLKFVLMQDRTNLNPQLLERMRYEMIDLLSKYVEMDKDALELNFAQEGESMALMLSIPVIRAKDEEEIQALIAEEDAKKKESESEESEESEEEETEESEESEEEVCACGLNENEDESECPDCDCDSQCDEASDDGCQEVEEEIQEETKKSKKNKN